MPVVDVAAKWSMSVVTVRKACPEFGVTPKAPGPRPYSKHERDKKIAEFCNQHTIAEAIEEFGVTSSVITKACRDRDVSLVPRQRRNLRTLVIVRKLLDGERQIDIARDEQCSRQHVQQVKTLAKDAGFDL